MVRNELKNKSQLKTLISYIILISGTTLPWLLGEIEFKISFETSDNCRNIKVKLYLKLRAIYSSIKQLKNNITCVWSFNFKIKHVNKPFNESAVFKYKCTEPIF